jgi:prepilin-type N-terminal cleavage/methylation domain-containing protein/prepilin-type processing-associated H-X9-DG protein
MPLNRPARSGQAFTLVELLLVLAIIAVLAALLLPALNGARNRSKTAACANNQRQIHVGFSAYLTANNGYYPYLTRWLSNGETPSWYAALSPYLGYSTNGAASGSTALNTATPITCTVKVLQCPANPWPFGSQTLPGSYTLNTQGFPVVSQNNWGSAVSTTNTNPNYWSKRVNQNDIVHPDGLLLLGEMPNAPPFYNVGGFVTTGRGLPQNYYWSGLTPCAVTNMYILSGGCVSCNLPFNYFMPACNENIAFFHNLGMNVLYPDGHAERLSQAVIFQYSLQIGPQGSGAPPCAAPWTTYGLQNNTPGGIFWDDGKLRTAGVTWYFNHFPGTTVTSALE